jgi:hypothetical protein
MGWRGAGGNGAATIGTYFGFGGVLMILGSVGEVSTHFSTFKDFRSVSNENPSQWIIGNTFPFVVFGSFGAFWLTFGFTNVPFYNAAGAFVTSTYTTGTENPEFNASFGKLYLLPMTHQM